MQQDFKDYYNIIGVSFSATETEIKVAYRKMAREFHPDMHPDETEYYTQQFQEITEAYETLSDINKKGRYDLKYRQLVLFEGPQYEYVVDETPPDNRQYKHKYTYRNKRTFSFVSVVVLLFLLFQVIRMVINAAPINEEKYSNRSYRPLPSAVQANGFQREDLGSSSDSLVSPYSNAPFMDKARH